MPHEEWKPFEHDMQDFIDGHHRIATEANREGGRRTYSSHVSIEDIHAITDARHAQAPQSPLRNFLTKLLHKIHPNG